MSDSSGVETMQMQEEEGLFETLSEQVCSDAQRPANSLRSWMETAERWRISEALQHCRGNRSAAARELRIGRRTLYAKMERLGIGAYAEPRGKLGEALARKVSSIRH